MKNYIQKGDVIEFTTSGAVAAGATVVIGTLVGIAITSAAASGETISVQLTGVVEVAKAAGVVTQGALVYWSTANSNATTTSAGNTLMGKAFVAAADADATIKVRLTT